MKASSSVIKLREDLAAALRTAGEWREQLHALQDRFNQRDDDAKKWRQSFEASKKEIEAVREQFADLKTRLHDAETANQFMRGYIARLQEDDVVREELVVTGDPGGETQMVPKRKHKQFPRPDDYSQLGTDFHPGHMYYPGNDKPKPKHWITY